MSGNQMLGFILVLPVVAALVVVLLPGSPVLRQSQMLNILASTGIPVLAVALLFWLMRRNAAAKAQNLGEELPGFYDPRTLELGPEHLVAIDATGEGKTRWSAVKDIVRTPDRILIQIVGGTWYVVPCRAFASAEEATRFAETAEALWRDSDLNQAAPG